MGIVVSVIVIGVAIADYISGSIVDDLKDQIKIIINAHQNDVETVKKLKKLVQKLDLTKLKQALKKMSKQSKNNLQTILNDQQFKIYLLKTISVSEQQAKNYDTTLSKIINVATYIFNIAMAMQLMVAPVSGPIGWVAFTALTALLGTVLNIFHLIGNIQQISELKQQKNRLNQYFKAGGQFQDTQKKLRQLSLQVTQDFYIFVITFRSMINENYAIISMLSVDNSFKNFNYSQILQQLQKSPFSKSFEDSCYALVQDMRKSDQQNDLNKKLQLFVRKLQAFENNYNISSILQEAQRLVQLFDEKTILSMQIAKQLNQMKQITNITSAIQQQFARRSKLTKQDQKKIIDKQIKTHLNYIVSSDSANKNLEMALAVAFYTDSFYGDSQDGKTFLEYDLKTLNKKASLLNCIGTSSGNLNFIVLPQPNMKSPDYQKWISDKNRLTQSLLSLLSKRQSIQMEQLKKNSQFQKIYLRLQNVQFSYNNTKYNRLMLFKGIFYTISIRNQMKFQNFEQKLEDGHFNPTKSETVVKLALFKQQQPISFKNNILNTQNVIGLMPALQQFDYLGKNLQQLAKFGCLYVNGAIYVHKMNHIQITQQDKQFHLKVISQNNSISQDNNYKFLEYFILSGKEQIQKLNFYKQKFQSQGFIINSIQQFAESVLFWLIK